VLYSKDRVLFYSYRSIFTSTKAISDIDITTAITTISLYHIILKASYTVRVFLGYGVKRFRQYSKELAFSQLTTTGQFKQDLSKGIVMDLRSFDMRKMFTKLSEIYEITLKALKEYFNICHTANTKVYNG